MDAPALLIGHVDIAADVDGQRARAEQAELFGEIWVLPPEGLNVVGDEDLAAAA